MRDIMVEKSHLGLKSLQEEQGQEQKGKTEKVQTCCKPGNWGKKKQ